MACHEASAADGEQHVLTPSFTRYYKICIHNCTKQWFTCSI